MRPPARLACVYQGEHVNVRCYWNGASNEGWINTHYVDHGMTASDAAPGVPHCAVGSGNGADVAGSETSGGEGGGQVLGASTTPMAVYYSPYEGQAIYQLAAGHPTKLIRFSTGGRRTRTAPRTIHESPTTQQWRPPRASRSPPSPVGAAAGSG